MRSILLAIEIAIIVSLTALAQQTVAVAPEAQSSRALSAASYLDRGNGWLKQGEFERAIAEADFDQAIKLAPRLAEVWHNRAVTLPRLDRLPEAEADFARFRELGGRLKPEAEQLWRESQERLKQK